MGEIKIGSYIIEIVSGHTYKVKNWDKKCPLPNTTMTLYNFENQEAEIQFITDVINKIRVIEYE